MTASAGAVLEQLHEEYGGLVDFLTLYVRETHPGDVYPQPRSHEEKVQHARDFRRREDISWPVLVDDLQGSYHRALDGKPNSVYLIDRDGRVAYRQLWAGELRPLRSAIEKLLAGRSELGERENRWVPMMRGLGVMDQTLRGAGESARRDLRKAAPPIFGLAVLASLFRPLPPLGRSLAAGGVALGAIALVGAGAAALVRGLRPRKPRARALARTLRAAAPVAVAESGIQRGRRAARQAGKRLRKSRMVRALR